MMQLHYQSIGAGQPLILLHGLFGSADNWGIVVKHFSQHYQVISVDLRNHGRSPHNDSQSYEDMAEDLLALCNTLNLDMVHLLGHSLGGKVAMQFATTYPERVDKLIIVDMAMRTYQDEHTDLINAMMAVDLTRMQSRSDVDKALRNAIPNILVRQFLLMNLIKADEQLQWRINLPAIKLNYPSLLMAVCENALYDKPSLFIRGERSDYILADDTKHIQTHFTLAEFESLPTGHWVHAEQPQAFMEVVEQFLAN